MKNKIALMLSVTLLAGCGTMIAGQTQDITILAPGAEGAECYLYNEDMRYKVRAGEKREIMKSNHDLTVECLAPGNRQRTVIVDVQLEPAAIANVSNAVVPGVTYDHLSRGLYSYPEVVSVDFNGVAAKPYPLPAYMNADVRGVANGDAEDYGPAILALPGEERLPAMITKKNWGESITDSPFTTGGSSYDGGSGSSGGLIPVSEK